VAKPLVKVLPLVDAGEPLFKKSAAGVSATDHGDS